MKVKKRVTEEQDNYIRVVLDLEEDILSKSMTNIIFEAGYAVLHKLVESNISRLCGERYKHRKSRNLFRWGYKKSEIILAGKKITLQHGRVRDVENNREVTLEDLEALKITDPLEEKVLEQMKIGVSTRKYRRSLESVPENIRSYGTSKSSVSRHFVAKTKAQLAKWLNARIEEDFPILMIDGIEFTDTTVVVVLGINKKGQKRVLGAWDGSTENSQMCTDLLNNLIERGLNPKNVHLAVIDGSKALRKGLRDIFGNGFLVQRCQLHKMRNVKGYLPENMKNQIWQAMSEAYASTDYETAKRLLLNIKRRLDDNHPRAASSLEEGMEETLTLHRIGAPKAIRKSLSTTNPIESLNSTIRAVTRRVKHWRDSKMILRWVYASITEAERKFRSIRGYTQMPHLLSLLELKSEEILNERRIA